MNFDRTPLRLASFHQERAEQAQALLRHIRKEYKGAQVVEDQPLL
jgi:hypothetical protein